MSSVRSLMKMHLGKSKNTTANRKERSFINRLSNRSSFEANRLNKYPALRRKK